MKTFLFALAFCFTTFATSNAGYKVGDTARDFKLKDVGGRMVSMADNKDAKGFIVIFTCNHCPYSVAYEDRIIALHKAFAPKGYPVIAINPNDPVRQPEDSYENMKVRANEKKFMFPYLLFHLIVQPIAFVKSGSGCLLFARELIAFSTYFAPAFSAESALSSIAPM